MDENRIFPNGEYFHICNKSISNYHIFRKNKSIERFLLAVNYYNNQEVNVSLSKALRDELILPEIMEKRNNGIFSLLAYCVMPDHYHLLLRMISDYSLAKFMNNIEGSYSHYYNLLNMRKGPLWQSRFRASIIEDNETLLHVHRYIHLNPTTAGLVDKPIKWPWSSYRYFIKDRQALSIHKEISITSVAIYKQFVNNQINYQRTIKGIRRKLLE